MIFLTVDWSCPPLIRMSQSHVVAITCGVEASALPQSFCPARGWYRLSTLLRRHDSQYVVCRELGPVCEICSLIPVFSAKPRARKGGRFRITGPPHLICGNRNSNRVVPRPISVSRIINLSSPRYLRRIYSTIADKYAIVALAFGTRFDAKRPFITTSENRLN